MAMRSTPANKITASRLYLEEPISPDDPELDDLESDNLELDNLELDNLSS